MTVRKRKIVATLALVAGLAGVCGGLAQLRVDTDIASVMPANAPSVQELEAMAGAFGGDPLIVLLETREPDRLLSGKTLPRIVGLEGELAREPDTAAIYGPGTVLNQIARQAQNMLAEISGRRDALHEVVERREKRAGKTAAEAASSAAEAAAAFDRRYGSLAVQGLPAGLPTLKNPRFVHTVLFDQSGQPRPRWRHIVPSRSAVAVVVRPRDGLDQAGVERLVRAVRNEVAAARLPVSRATVTGAPAVAAALGEQVRGEIPLLGAAALALVAAVFLAVPGPRGRRRLLRLVPVGAALLGTAVIMALLGWIRHPVSLGAAAFLPIVLAFGSFYALYLVNGAHRKLVVVAAVASSAAFAALAVSPLPFVRELGLMLAAGVLVSVAIGLVASRWVETAHSVADTGYKEAAASAYAPSRLRRFTPLVALLAVAAAGWAAVPMLRIEADPRDLASGLTALDDVRHVENVIGSSGEVALVLRGGDVLAPAALRWSRSVTSQVAMDHGDDLRPIVSVADTFGFLGDRPTAAQTAAAVRLLPSYLATAVVTPDRAQSLTSFGIRLQDLDRQARLLEHLRARLPSPPPGYRVELVGLPVVAAAGYELLQSDRLWGNIAGIVAAGLVLAFGLRRGADTGKAVLAAVLATGTGFGLLWLAGLGLSPLTLALGSLTAAVGCEFTALLAHAARFGDRTLARSVRIAASATSLAFLVLAASSLSILREFGLMLAASVALSYCAAYVVLRALPAREVPVPASPGVQEGSPTLVGGRR